MLRFFFAITLLIVVSACNQTKEEPSLIVASWVQQEVDSIGTDLEQLILQAEDEKKLSVNGTAQQLFISARRHYKKIEAIAEFHFPGVAEAINGPALPEAEEFDDKVNEPTGFQVIEELMFPSINLEDREQLVIELKAFKSIIEKLKEQLKTNSWTDQNIFEASRIQLIRIMSLGISGFDSPIALMSIDEAKTSLEGIEKTLLYYSSKLTNESDIENLKKSFTAAKNYLADDSDFNSFDRATFIVDYLTPLSKDIYAYQKSCGIANNKWLSPVNMNETNFASASSIQLAWFTPSYNNSFSSNKDVINLGKLLFFDPLLSGNNSRSCASCHNPQKAFTDGREKSMAFNFQGSIDRNAPTLINVGFQKNQFADSRVQFLEDQVVDVISNSSEMHGQIATAANSLNLSEEYRELFSTAFSKSKEEKIAEEQIQAALASYIRSLNGFNSKADSYLEGNKQALTPGEISGFNLFMGKGKCATCHFMPLFNGSVPPTFNESESEIIGVPLNPDTINAVVDGDVGKFNTYKIELHKNAFKTPTVRNSALTAPYMHNGVYSTLEQVIDFYNRGGGAGIGINLDNQTLPPEPLNLSEKEKADLISFLHALTDTVGLTSVPNALPLFKDKKLNARKVGGAY